MVYLVRFLSLFVSVAHREICQQTRWRVYILTMAPLQGGWDLQTTEGSNLESDVVVVIHNILEHKFDSASLRCLTLHRQARRSASSSEHQPMELQPHTFIPNTMYIYIYEYAVLNGARVLA